MKFRIALVTALLLSSVAQAEITSMPSGTYKLDPLHTSITFKISHFGFSHFTGRFDKCEGSYDYRADDPLHSVMDVTIHTDSIDTNDAELDEILETENWFDVVHYPHAVFHTTSIEKTGDNTAKITGDFTLHGITNPLVLDATLVGAGTMPLFGTQIMGFSATGKFSRADYGISNLEPFIGDEVTLQIESEFDKDQDNKDQDEDK